jgi:hypothetical protein
MDEADSTGQGTHASSIFRHGLLSAFSEPCPLSGQHWESSGFETFHVEICHLVTKTETDCNPPFRCLLASLPNQAKAWASDSQPLMIDSPLLQIYLVRTTTDNAHCSLKCCFCTILARFVPRARLPIPMDVGTLKDEPICP